MRAAYTAAEMRTIADEIAEASQIVRGIADQMDREQMPQVSIHAQTVLNKHLQALLEWASRTRGDADSQCRVFARARRDRARADQLAATQARPRPPRRHREAGR